MRVSVRVVSSVVAAVAMGLAGCAEETPGNATPGNESGADRPTIPTDGPDPSEETSTEPPAGGSPLADLEPCDLVSADQAAELGISGGEADQFGEARVCVWRYEGASISDSFTVQLDFFEERSVDDVVGSDIKPVPTVGSHRAVRYVDTAGGCAVAINTGPSSRVDTRVVGGEEQKGCQLAMQLATLVEPGLP